MTDTIYSISSGQGKAGVAVIRISGPHSDAVLVQMAGKLPDFRRATVMVLKDAKTAERLDLGLVLRFAKGASFTGEESCELHVHGGRAVVRAVMRSLSQIPGLRLAEAGEFTRRALENGRLDLTQVEALSDLLDAHTDVQRRHALRGLEGQLGRAVAGWREHLLEIRSRIAADIDFSDEGDVGDTASDGIDSLLQQLEMDIKRVVATAEAGRLVNEGFRVAIVGPPNAGKSTLFNALAGTEAAIVTEHAGTTRDVLDVTIEIAGHAVVLLDTAGLRETVDPVEAIGIARGRFVAERADLILQLQDVHSSSFFDDASDFSAGLDRVDLIRIRSKSDLVSLHTTHNVVCDLSLSAVTGDGLAALRSVIAKKIDDRVGHSESLWVIGERQKNALGDALAACLRARSSISHGIEFLDEEVRAIDHALANLLGFVDVEEVLGAVFSRFCVGK